MHISTSHSTKPTTRTRHVPAAGDARATILSVAPVVVTVSHSVIDPARRPAQRPLALSRTGYDHSWIGLVAFLAVLMAGTPFGADAVPLANAALIPFHAIG
jgi:hypothetical protein